MTANSVGSPFSTQCFLRSAAATTTSEWFRGPNVSGWPSVPTEIEAARVITVRIASGIQSRAASETAKKRPIISLLCPFALGMHRAGRNVRQVTPFFLKSARGVATIR